MRNKFTNDKNALLALEAFKAINLSIKKICADKEYEISIQIPQWIMINDIYYKYDDLMSMWLREKFEETNKEGRCFF